MKWWKKMRKGVSLLACLTVLTGSSIVAAQTVTVEGIGDDRGGAINDAKRIAVEEVVGTYLQSKTIVNNGELNLDSIYSKTAGFVRNVKIVSEGYKNGGYYVQATIDISDEFVNEAEKELMVVASMNNPRIGIELTGTINGQQAPKHYLKTFEIEIIQYLLKKGMTHVFVLEAPHSIDNSYEMINNDTIIEENISQNNDNTSSLDNNIDVPEIISQDVNQPFLDTGSDNAINDNIIVTEQEEGVTVIVDSEEGVGDISYNAENHIDYILQGNLTARSNSIKLPSYKEMTSEGISMYDTGLTRSIVIFQAGLYHAVTKEVMGEFQLNANAIDNTTDDSITKAISSLSIQVGDKVWEVFNQHVAIMPHGITLNANTNDYDKIIRLADWLRNQAAIQGVTVRAYSDGVGTLSVDTELTSSQLYKIIRSFDGMFVSMGNQSDGLLEINI